MLEPEVLEIQLTNFLLRALSKTAGNFVTGVLQVCSACPKNLFGNNHQGFGQMLLELTSFKVSSSS